MKTALSLSLVVAAAGPLAWAQQLELLVEGLSRPVDFAHDPTSPERFYVVEQGGTIRVIESGQVRDEPFLRLAPGRISTGNWEQGLLGMAFDPGYGTNRRLYINFTAADGATHIVRCTADSPYRVDPDSEELILRVAQPYGNHNGGSLVFGPDGMLYIGLGDGGAANDPHGHGQRLDSLLGKMLRIDVTAEPDAPLAYAIPADNPFVGRDGARGEIWALGLRNPWKYSFDSTGRMWIGDVGQNRYEEIHLQPAGSRGGENYGWNVMEGPAEFRPGAHPRDDPEPLPPEEHRRRGFEPPVWWYRQSRTGSVTGGYFYEGERIAALRGRYLFADFETGQFWSFRLDEQGRADDVVEHTRSFARAFGGRPPRQAISSFGRDADGELYVLDHARGRVFRVVP